LYKYLELVGLEIGLEFKIDDSNYSNYGKSTVYLDKNSNPLARLIQVSNKTKKKYQIPLSKVVWILTLDYKETKKVNNYKLYFDESDYPNAKRTYSFLINKNLKYSQIKTVLESSNLDNSIKIYLSPIERISLENKDIINIEVTFVNYAKTFETEFFENYEKQIISSLKLIDPEISLR
jgi:phenylalanyl-tRNA synthetase beta subunit